MFKNILPDQSNQKLHEYIKAFKNFRDNVNFASEGFDAFIKKAEKFGGRKFAEMFSNLAKEGENAKISIEDCYATILGEDTKGLGNVADIIKTFNEAIPAEDRESFADAVSQTNEQLGEYLKNVGEGQASTIAYGKSLATATLKTIGLEVATAAANAAISLGVSLLLQWGTQLASMFIDEIANGVANATERLNEHVDAVKSLETEIKGLQDEAKKVRDRIVELQNISVPTFFEQDELNILKEENEELERNIKLKKAEQEVERYKASESAHDAATIMTEGTWQADVLKNVVSRYVAHNPLTGIMGPILGAIFNSVADETFDKPQFDKDLKILEEYESKIKRLRYWEESYAAGNTSDKVYKEMVESNEASRKELEATLSSERATMELYLAQLDPKDPKNAELIEQLQNFINTYDALYNDVNGLNVSTFSEVYESIDFAQTTDKLDRLAKEGKLTEETFANVQGIEEFKAALESIGIDTGDVGEIIRAIIKRVDESADVAESAGDKYNYLTSQIEELKAVIDSTFTNQSTLQSAFDKIQEGSSLSADEVRKLVDICSEDFPEISTLFEKTADGYTISANNLIKANQAIIDSTKRTIQKEIAEYNEVINAYEHRGIPPIRNWLAGGLPDADSIGLREYDVGITAEKYEDAKNKVNEFTLILDMFGISLDDNTISLEKYNEVMKTFTSNISTGASAQQEMNENGQISASTLESLLSLGDEYIKCINIENGVISFNAELFKDISKAKLEDELATVRLAEAEAIYNRNVDAMYGGHNHERLQSILDDITLKRQLLEDRYNNIDDIFSKAVEDKGSKDTSDPNKDAFDAEVAKRKHWLEMGKDELGNIFTKADYYEWLNGADGYKKYFQDVSKYQTEIWANEEEVFKYYQDLYKEETQKTVDDIEKQYERGELSFEQYMENLAEIRENKYGDKSKYAGSEFATEGYKTLTDQMTNASEKNADTEVDKYKSNLSKKNITPEDYVKSIYKLQDSYKKLYNVDLSQKWLDDALDVDNYERRLEQLQNINDKSLASERVYIAEWRKLNSDTYGDKDSKYYDISKYESNLKEIIEYELKVLEEAYRKGEISAKEYAEAVNKSLSESDILGADYIADKQEELDKTRAEHEKSYWEQQKKYVESYYGKQIEELEKVKEEQEKVNKLGELYLKLEQNRKALEDAKNNKNQLIFHNGTFEYVTDQDEIKSAQEEINSTLKEIEDEKLQTQIDILKSQKDEAVSFYDDMISMIETYISKTVDITENDPEILQKIANSEYAELWRQIRSGEKTANEITEEQKDFVKKGTDKPKATSTAMDFVASLLNMSTAELQNVISNFLGTSASVAQGVMGSVAQDTLNSAINNVYTDSTVNNNVDVKVGDVNMNIQGGTSQEMLTQFANQLSTAFSTAVAKSFA